MKKDLDLLTKDIIERLKARGADLAWCSAAVKETREFNVDGGEFSLLRTLFDNSLTVTAVKDGKKGSVGLNSFEDEAVSRAIDDCLAAAEASHADDGWGLCPDANRESFTEGEPVPDLDRLFDRSRRVVTLTPAGREFEPHARKLLADYDEMMASIKRFSNSGHLHIGSVDHMGRVGLTTPISTFLKQYPDGGVTIDIERGTSLGVMDQLVAGKLDMAFIAHIISPFSKASNIDAYQLDHYRLYTLVVDNYHAIVSRRHRFAGLDVVTWQDLAEEKLVILDKSYGLNAIIRESFRQCGLRPNIAFECDQVDAILGMVEGNFGISILSKRIAATQYDVEAIPIDPPISRNTVLVVPKEVEARQRLAGGFVRHIVDYYRDNTPGPCGEP